MDGVVLWEKGRVVQTSLGCLVEADGFKLTSNCY